MPFSLATLAAKIGIKGGVIIMLAVALGIAFLVHKGDTRAKDKLRSQVATAQANLAISNGSIDLLQAKIAEMNADTDRRAAEYTAAQKQALEASQRLAESEKGSDALIARLKARAAQGGAECVVPKDLKQAAEGL